MRIRDDPAFASYWPSRQDLLAPDRAQRAVDSSLAEPMLAMVTRLADDPSGRDAVETLRGELEDGPAAALSSVMGFASVVASGKGVHVDKLVAQDLVACMLSPREAWSKLVDHGLVDVLARFFGMVDPVRRCFKRSHLTRPTTQATASGYMIIVFLLDIFEQVPVQLLDGLIVYARKVPAAERDRLISVKHIFDRIQFELFIDAIQEALTPLGRYVVASCCRADDAVRRASRCPK